MGPDIDERQRRLLEALVLAACRLHERPETGDVDSYAESAGERTVLVLVDYGLLTVLPYGRIFGRWTALGEQFRRAVLDKYDMDDGDWPSVEPLPLGEPDSGEELGIAIDAREGRLLEAAFHMVYYCRGGGRLIPSFVEYGLIEITEDKPHTWRWTEMGKRVWRARNRFDNYGSAVARRSASAPRS
jgi:hypothetical protein